MRSGKSQQKSGMSLRDRIVKEASKEFLKKGIKSVRMDDIAALLTISKRTLYEQFNDKEELLYNCIIFIHSKKKKEMQNAVCKSDNVMEIVLKALQFHINMLKATYPDFIFEIRKYPAIQEYISKEREENSQEVVEFFLKGVEQGFFRPDINYEFLMTWFRYQGDFMLTSDLYHKYSAEEMFETMMYVNIRGISTEKGLKILNDYKKENDNK